MTVKEVKQQIENLQRNYDDMIKLQDYFLGLKAPEDVIEPIIMHLDDDTGISRPFRILCTDVAETLANEIKRLNNLIDNTVVEIR